MPHRSHWSFFSSSLPCSSEFSLFVCYYSFFFNTQRSSNGNNIFIIRARWLQFDASINLSSHPLNHTHTPITLATGRSTHTVQLCLQTQINVPFENGRINTSNDSIEWENEERSEHKWKTHRLHCLVAGDWSVSVASQAGEALPGPFFYFSSSNAFWVRRGTRWTHRWVAAVAAAAAAWRSIDEQTKLIEESSYEHADFLSLLHFRCAFPLDFI